MHVASAGFAGVRAGVLVFGRHLAVLRGRCVLWSLPVLLWVLPYCWFCRIVGSAYVGTVWPKSWAGVRERESRGGGGAYGIP